MITLEDLDERVRNVETAVVELATMAKMMRVLVVVVAAGVGVDLTGVGV